MVLMDSVYYTLTQHADGSAILTPSDSAFVGASIPASHWQAISDAVYTVLWQQRNQTRERIKSGHDTYSTLKEVPILRWKREITLFQGEGKELLVLLWGIELATPEQIPQAIINWRGLAREERWWLATQTGAVRTYHGWTAERGWRKALYHILCENPVSIAR